MPSPDAVAALAVRRIHARRDFPELQRGLCVEDRQDWPCATIKAMDEIYQEAERQEAEGHEEERF